MGFAADALRLATSALLGISTYQNNAPPVGAPEASVVERMRRVLGGQLQPQSTSITRWYLSDIESALFSADNGNMELCAKLMRAARQDGVIAGVLSTRTDGLVRLPKTFRGDPEIVSALQVGHDSVRSVFDEMCPPQELALMAADGILLGFAVGELVPVEGRDYPLLVRLDPAYLVYRWNENRWYFQSVAGLIAITPGDGRWVLHTPGGRMTPWQNGMWRAIGRAYVRKEHAALHKDNWEAKLANPARIAIAPQGAAEEHKTAHFQNMLAWGVNTVLGMSPGYDAKLLESNGRGWESFVKTITEQNNEIVITLAGQTVTTDGGAGFSNADVHKSIRADLIKATADSLSYTVNTQIIPVFTVIRFGPERLARGAQVEWDVTPPKDRNSEALSLSTTAQAIDQLTVALAAHGLELDVPALCAKFGVPIKNDVDGDGVPDTQAPEADNVHQIRRAA